MTLILQAANVFKRFCDYRNEEQAGYLREIAWSGRYVAIAVPVDDIDPLDWVADRLTHAALRQALATRMFSSVSLILSQAPPVVLILGQSRGTLSRDGRYSRQKMRRVLRLLLGSPMPAEVGSADFCGSCHPPACHGSYPVAFVPQGQISPPTFVFSPVSPAEMDWLAYELAEGRATWICLEELMDKVGVSKRIDPAG